MAPNSQSKGYINSFFRSLDRKPTDEEVVRELHLVRELVVYQGHYLCILRDDRNVVTAKGPPEVTVIRSRDFYHIGIWKTTTTVEIDHSVSSAATSPVGSALVVTKNKFITTLHKHISMHRTRYYKFRELYQSRRVSEAMLYLADLQMKRTPDSKEAEDWYTSIVRNQLLITG